MNKWLIAWLVSFAMCTGAQAQQPATPGTITLVPLDVATVTTGGTAVTALIAGHRSKGGWLNNPSTATTNLCVAEVGTAASIPGGNTTCLVPGQTLVLTASANAVSVVASDSSHVFSGVGWQ
jgi:hypothetical protein